MNNTLNGIIQYFGAMPPPYNLIYDLNRDGLVNVIDLLLALSL